MKKLIIILVVLALGAGGYFIWKKYFSSDNLVRSIPQDAVFVGAVDLKSIVEKAGGNQLNDMNMIKRLREEMAKVPDSVMASLDLMDNPLKTGINFLKRVYFFVDNQDGNKVVGMTCGLLSSADFENMLKKFPAVDSIKQDGDLKSLKFDDKMLLTWNGEQLIILGSDKKTALDDYMKSLFEHSRPSITSVKGFREFNKREFDIGGFMNYSSLLAFARNMSPASAAVPEDFYKGMYADFVTQFQDNSVQTKMNYYFSDSKMSESMMVMNEKGISSDQAKMVTSENVLALLAFSINPEKMIGLFEKEALYNGIFKEIEQQVGLKKDDLKNLTNGEITLAMVDVKNEVVTREKYMFDQKTMQMVSHEVQDTSLMPVFTASMGIKDRQVFDKLMKSTGLQKQGPYYIINVPGLQMYMVDNKTGITLTNDQAIANELAQKKELADMPEPSKSLATKSACTFYFDLNLQHYPQQVNDMMQKMMGPDGYPAFQKTMALFEDVEVTTDRSSGLLEVRLVKGTDNSLHRILEAIDKNAYAYVADQEAKQKKMMEEYEASMQPMDSVVNVSR